MEMTTERNPDLSVDSGKIEMTDTVYALAASPNFRQDSLCFAARSSGLYRSNDGGLSWHDAYQSLQLQLETALITSAVALSPHFEQDRTVFAGAPGGVLRSVDGGESWYVAQLPSPPPFVSALVVSPNFARDGTLFAGTWEDGVFRCTDRGSRWASWNFGLLDLNIVCLAISPHFTHDETLFAGTDSGIFRSTNGGRAWREVGLGSVHLLSPLPTDFAPVVSLALSPNYLTDGILLAGTETQGLWHSTDRGNHWTRLGAELIAGAVNGIILGPAFPTKPDILIWVDENLFISRNQGQSWSDWATDLTLTSSISAVVAPQGLEPGAPLLVGLTGGEVLRI
jgi:hypothetical protein